MHSRCSLNPLPHFCGLPLTAFGRTRWRAVGLRPLRKGWVAVWLSFSVASGQRCTLPPGVRCRRGGSLSCPRCPRASEVLFFFYPLCAFSCSLNLESDEYSPQNGNLMRCNWKGTRVYRSRTEGGDKACGTRVAAAPCARCRPEATPKVACRAHTRRTHVISLPIFCCEPGQL